MKILDIKPLEGNGKFPFRLLSRGIHDDALFDLVHFEITIEPSPADYVNYFYRLLWEKSYIKLRMMSNSNEHDDDKDIKINISLSEAMGFINEATPPLLRHTISNIKTENDVVEALKVFLMEDNNNEQGHYIDIFRNHIRFKVFETNEPIDVAPMEKLKKSRYGFTVRIIDSTEPFSVILPKSGASRSAGFTVLCMFKSNGPDDLKAIKDILNSEDAMVSNMTIKNGSVYIRASIRYIETCFGEEMENALRDCYEGFI